MENRSTQIRPLVRGDEPAWRELWRGYLAYYETELSPEMYRLAFDRMLSGNDGEFRGLIAERAGRSVGIAHYLFHRHGWRAEPVCYLQDLFVAPEARGTGAGRALIEAVYSAADAASAPRVYWLTQHFNEAGRRLYDRVGNLSPFIKYDRPA